ncbi:hypothetical protein [Nocardiopsis metallicus]|uniref:Uncharacterized protein n=1 Tax=Nocardiopsis metallicus TaxID=179819 RepID=A0A840W9P3_9ACTN|nr:hypothetical protein [Nocardiopsis metallicus]MBB5489771.1 hypothetical protein [Nocardiopsis metallicus]
MPSPKFRLTCCLCDKLIPLNKDVQVLDAEWLRRFPHARGTFSCFTCVSRNHWSCKKPGGDYVEGHIPAVDEVTGEPKPDADSINHLLTPGTHKGAVQAHPWSGLVQGAEEYLRHRAQRLAPGSPEGQRLHAMLAEWDARDSLTNGRL